MRTEGTGLKHTDLMSPSADVCQCYTMEPETKRGVRKKVVEVQSLGKWDSSGDLTLCAPAGGVVGFWCLPLTSFWGTQGVTILPAEVCVLLFCRVSLFLAKMRTFLQSPAVTSVYCEEDREEILTRATELMNLLKMPSVAQFVFTPSVDASRSRFQKEVNDTLPSALRIVTRLLEPAPGFASG